MDKPSHFMEPHFSLNALFPSIDNGDLTVQHAADERQTMNTTTQRSSESPSADLLWQDVDNLSIPDSPQIQQNDRDIIISQNPPNVHGHQSSIASTVNSTTSGSPESSSSGGVAMTATTTAAAAAVFNISWGGNDKPPVELHLDRQDGSETMVSRKPLPKPRGVKRLPEPEPAEDGTLDEETLRRRRNTFAARRSRMKKFLKIEYLENRVNALQTENAKLVLNNALLESEKKSWLAKEAEYKKRIKALEASAVQNRDETAVSGSRMCQHCQNHESNPMSSPL